MAGRTLFLYHPLYDGRGFSPIPESWERYKLVRRFARESEMFERGLQEAEPDLAVPEILTRVHTPAYLDHVRERDAQGSGFMDYGDTPVYRGLYDRTRASVGASLLGLRAVMEGRASHAFNPSGGLHHAFPDRAAGFCVFNDVAIAARSLQEEYGLERIAILDIDGHHGDGTQAIFWEEPVLTLSLHRYGGRFFPGTGSTKETGRGAGAGFAINVPLLRGTPDGPWLRALEEVVAPALRAYRPEFLIVEMGVDGHYNDPLVGLALTTAGFEAAAKLIHMLAHELCQGRLLVLGGGGYSPTDAARCWLVGLNGLAEILEPEELRPFHDSRGAPSPNGDAEVELEGVLDDLRHRLEWVFG